MALRISPALTARGSMRSRTLRILFRRFLTEMAFGVILVIVLSSTCRMVVLTRVFKPQFVPFAMS